MAKVKPIQPYTANEIDGARAVIESADAALEFIAKCTACKTDMTAYREQVTEMKNFAQAIIEQFGGG